jgi:Flp pilus assembly pilin Flp
MTNLIKTFATSESGAVTVDWVVLTAALVGLGLAVMAVVSGGVENLSGDIGQALAETNPNTDPFENNATFTGQGGGTYTMPTTTP